MGKDNPRPRERVTFKPPKMEGAERISGRIVDWTPFRKWSGKTWGQYRFQAQRIKWDHGWESVRIVYYRRNTPHDRWRFASQMTVNSTQESSGKSVGIF
jgi:hypothetical protein